MKSTNNTKKIRKVKDKFNNKKVWIVKKSKCNHYYLNQEICGLLFYSKFIRITKSFLTEVGIDI